MPAVSAHRRGGRAGRWLARLLIVAAAGSAGLTLADIGGTVRDDSSGEPLAGVLVSVQARPDLGTAVTGADGRFHLPLPPSNDVLQLGAAMPYDAAAEVNYLIRSFQAFDGMEDLDITLFRSPDQDNPHYLPIPANWGCNNCHGNHYQQWRQSRHAGSAVNEWVRDLYSGDGTPGGAAGYVFRNSHDPGDTGFCAACHAPLQDVFTPGEVYFDEVSSPAGLDGVTCLACHQIAGVDAGNINALHHLGKTQYRFPQAHVATEMFVWGPLPDVIETPMQAHYSPLHSDPLLCAGCHQYENPDTGAPGQATYTEWLASPYNVDGPERRTCQNCHMEKEAGPGHVGNGGPLRPASQRSTHRFIGATPQRLAENIDLRVSVEQRGAQLLVATDVENQCGHHFPTGIDIRNALLVVDVRLDGQPLPQTRGPVLPFWASDDVPGEQPGDYAGWPGKGYAKVLEGRINGQGETVRPVLFIDAEAVHSDTTLPSGQTDQNLFAFALPVGAASPGTAQVDVRLLYRRAWRALAVTKGWTQTPGGLPVEMQVQRHQHSVVLTPVPERIFGHGFELPDGREGRFDGTGVRD